MRAPARAERRRNGGLLVYLILFVSLQAFLLALKTHFPSRYAAWFVDCPEVLDLVPSAPSGRVIKLTRVAKERLAGLL